MARLKNNYNESLWARLKSWYRLGSTAIDDKMQRNLSESVQETQRSEEEHAAWAQWQEARSDEALETERKLQSQVHTWSSTRVSSALRVLYSLFAVAACLMIIFMLLSAVSEMPPFGLADNPVNNEVSRRYIEDGLEETGAVNIVGGMILDYRAFDTLGESHVLFVAVCAVMLLLKINLDKNGRPTKEKLDAEADDRRYEPHHDVILQKISNVIVPSIILFGIYVVLNGHLSAGGGFSGGAIIGSGLILYVNAYGLTNASKHRIFSYKTFKGITFTALAFYGLAKGYSFFTGANHLPSGIPIGHPGDILSAGLILPLNIAVGAIVAWTMLSFYTLFRKGDF
ncbi:MAG: hypothetical protein IJJ23_08575 [Clostridia bacterium]|nr:hypothetical protein [Clostridia bacterium]